MRLVSERDSFPDAEHFESMFADVVIVTVNSLEVIAAPDADFLVQLAKIRGVGCMRDM